MVIRGHALKYIMLVDGFLKIVFVNVCHKCITSSHTKNIAYIITI